MSALPKNGTLTRIDNAGAPTVTGVETWATGPAINVRVTIDRPSKSQQISLGALLSKVSQVVYVMKSDLAVDAQILERDKVLAGQDGETARLMKVIRREFYVFRSITHYELFCQVM